MTYRPHIFRIERSKPFKGVKETSFDFRLGFALSNGPHLHRAYLVTVPFDLILAVYQSNLLEKIINRKYFVQLEKKSLSAK